MMHVVKDLPSHFRFYNKGVSVSISGYTLSDLYDFNENELSELDLISYYSKGIKVEGMPLEDLFFNDFKYLVINRKLMTSPTGNFVVETPCSYKGCDGLMTRKSSLGTLEFTDFSFSELPACFSFDWNGGVVNIEMTPFTLGDHIKLINMDKSESFSYRVASMIRNLGLEEAHDLVSSCTDGFFVSSIEYISNLFDFRVEPVQVTCGKCKRSMFVDIFDTKVLLRTLSGGKSTVGDGIHFGKGGISSIG